MIVLAACAIDGIFPPVPSETTVVAALAAGIAAGVDGTWAIAIVLAAAAGAVLGDSLAFWVGRRVGVDRFRWMRRPRARRMLGWIAERLRTSPATLVLVGRYIPVGRVAVNGMAGASGLPFPRFLGLAAVAGSLWACMCLAIASASAAWLGDPLWSAALGVVVMLALGLVVDLISRRVARRA
nr:VTT domain-containing protein [Agrococcus sp. ARC_14]